MIPAHHRHPTWLGLLVGGLVVSTAFAADVKLDPATFDFDHDGHVSETELAMYVAKRDKVTPDVSGLFDGQLRFIPSKEYPTLAKAMTAVMIDAARNGVVDIETGLNVRPPYKIKIDDVRKAVGFIVESGNPTSPALDEKRPPFAGIFGTPIESADGKRSRGPFRLRKSKDDWSGDLDDVSGATISATRNLLKQTETLSTEGALIYPFKWERWRFLPSASWKLSRIDAPPEEGVDPATAPPKDGEADELQFHVPFAYSATTSNASSLKRHYLEFAAYALTDSRFRGLVAGAQLIYSPYYAPEKGLAINTGYKGLCGSAVLGYRLRALPTVDFNRLYYQSRYIKRGDHDDRLAVGATTEVALKTSTGYPALELIVTHKFLQGITGPTDYGALLSGSLKLWFNDNAGISFDRQRGETPIAEKGVNSSTLGFELKF